MAFPPSASLENPSMPDAIHSFSSAASDLSPPVWPYFLLCFLVLYVLCLGTYGLWQPLGCIEFTYYDTADSTSSVSYRLARLCVVLYHSAPSFVASLDSTLFVLTCRLAKVYHRYHPKMLLKDLKRRFPIHVIVIGAHQARSITRAVARERDADRRAHIQQFEEERALPNALLNYQVQLITAMAAEQRALSETLLKLCNEVKQLTTVMAAEEAARATTGAIVRKAAKPAPAPGSMREHIALRYLDGVVG
ncbi:hypothetical protein G6514_009076 [Epicoccum nigrum]|nr:hypothetical protein G6514_009076 [Epicoccum nigrum]